ncbi:MAG: phosphate acetyltransferase [Clostridia bacterium]|nr:phosphate acetyltransferase [Clostridia bacterium]MBR2968983.1 phosphate acetyltransferase [Clostridia bacterium]
MSNVMETIKKKAALLGKNIVLPEGEDSRVVEAAAAAVKEGVAKITLLGNPEEIKANNPNVDLSGVTVIDPKTSPKHEEYATLLYELRKSKGMTIEEARQIAYDNTYFGVLMLKAGDVDGLVSGACHSTANTLRPGLQIVKTAPGVPLVSSYFLMIAPECGNQYCEDGCYIYADCGLEQNPDPDKLAYIAVASAKSAAAIANIEPRVALLSHSTKGSAKHADVDKVTAAVAKAKELAPELNIDGELQADAAIVPSVAKSKAPGSAVAGHANVLIFPDLDAGNIAYKLTERLGGFAAIGPVCQGFAKPINDLSRGCKAEDIVGTIAITVLQSEIQW